MIVHYKNGRAATIGDWVVGPTHNSNGRARCGLVVEIMPDQGPCNIKIHLWEDEHFTEEGHPRMIKAVDSRGRDDYADAKECIKVEDGLRMVRAVVQWGDYRSPYGG
jgi:hypothetical protein